MTTTILHNPPAEAHYRTPAVSGDVTAYVETRTLWQFSHKHHFTDLTRFGDAACHGCGARAWAAEWVADGIYGEGTERWIQAQINLRRAELAPVDLVLAVLGPAEVTTIAVLDGDAPAKHAAKQYAPKHRGHLRLV